MKTIFRCILILLDVEIWCACVYSQETKLPPYPKKNLIDPQVVAHVSKETTGYSYQYTVTNGTNASQDIDMFVIELRANVIKHSTARNWDVGPYNYDTIKVMIWDSYTPATLVHPTEIVSGYGILSSGLPSIQRSWLSSYEKIPSREGQYDPASATIFATSLTRITLGPVILREPFAPTTFLDTLISYKHQALALKWIDNGGVANSLDQKLENARRKLESGDSATARNILEAFVNEVEAQKDKHLTSEAYALLKFNAEYLIDRLPSPGKPEKFKEKK